MSALRILGIDNILFIVGDMAQARHFYEDILRLPVKFAVPQAGIVGYRLGDEEPGLLIRAGDVREGPPRDSPRVWLEVPDARAAAQALRDAGVAVLAEPFQVRTGWTVEIADPWGNVLGLTDYVTQPELGRRR